MDGDALHSGWLLTRWRPLFTWTVSALQLSIDLICEDITIADYWATKSEISGNRNVPILSLYRIRTLNRLDQSAIKYMFLRLRSHLMVNTSIDTRNVTFQNTLGPLYFYSFLHGQSNSRWHHVPASSFKVGQHEYHLTFRWWNLRAIIKIRCKFILSSDRLRNSNLEIVKLR